MYTIGKSGGKPKWSDKASEMRKHRSDALGRLKINSDDMCARHDFTYYDEEFRSLVKDHERAGRFQLNYEIGEKSRNRPGQIQKKLFTQNFTKGAREAPTGTKLRARHSAYG